MSELPQVSVEMRDCVPKIVVRWPSRDFIILDCVYPVNETGAKLAGARIRRNNYTRFTCSPSVDSLEEYGVDSTLNLRELIDKGWTEEHIKQDKMYVVQIPRDDNTEQLLYYAGSVYSSNDFFFAKVFGEKDLCDFMLNFCRTCPDSTIVINAELPSNAEKVMV